MSVGILVPLPAILIIAAALAYAEGAWHESMAIATRYSVGETTVACSGIVHAVADTALYASTFIWREHLVAVISVVENERVAEIALFLVRAASIGALYWVAFDTILFAAK